MAGIELIIAVFLISLVCGLIVRKVTRHDTINELREKGLVREDSWQPRTTKEGWFDNDIEGAVYDADGKRVK